jgi:EPS-associated MarR family transcriptional regulator
MNNLNEQENGYYLLKILSQESTLTQRDMAKKMGISLGKVNYYLSELAKKGLIKIIRLKNVKKKILYAYIITQKGMEERATLTVSFLKRKISEYEEIKKQINELTQEVEKDQLIDTSVQETFDNPRYTIR